MTQKPYREECLDKAKECICGQREQDYGTPEDNFNTIAKLWTVYLKQPISVIDVAMMMSLLKIARISSGGTVDSFVDLAGYAACGYEIFKSLYSEVTLRKGNDNGVETET